MEEEVDSDKDDSMRDSYIEGDNIHNMLNDSWLIDDEEDEV